MSQGTARRASYALSFAAAMLVCVVLGSSGSSAGAADQVQNPAPSATSTVKSTPTTGPLVANPDSGRQRSYQTRYWKVLANDRCGNVTPCTTAHMTAPMQITSFPAGWSVTLSPTDMIRVLVPANTIAGTRTIGYSITDASGTANATLTISVYLGRTPDHYNPRQGSLFSHAFVRGSAYRIRMHIERTINSVPPGGQIRILSWSFSSKTLRTALLAAKRRGVSVQIIMSPPVDPKMSDYSRLISMFGQDRFKKNPVTGSWVYACRASCRGKGGTMHAKIFLFSQAYNTRWVVMTGSGNMTDFAAQGQWNQQYTLVKNKTAYDDILKLFIQAKHDVPIKQPEVILNYPTTTYWFTPMNIQSAQNDYMYRSLNQVRCTNSGSASGRTKIRIAMYTWRDNRGDWMAHKVRQLWNQGCDIRIIYAIMGNQNKNILYSPAGRGRIPMRQTLLVDAKHAPVWYLHQKYVAIAGNIMGAPKSFEVFQGSFNFSDLGMRSDENSQKIVGYANFAPYNNDFNQVWAQPQTRAPDPNSYVLQEQRIGTSTGLYHFMEND